MQSGNIVQSRQRLRILYANTQICGVCNTWLCALSLTDDLLQVKKTLKCAFDCITSVSEDDYLTKLATFPSFS